MCLGWIYDLKKQDTILSHRNYPNLNTRIWDIDTMGHRRLGCRDVGRLQSSILQAFQLSSLFNQVQTWLNSLLVEWLIR